MIKRIIDQLQKSQSVLVASHANPDGDAIGALLATGLALKAMYKDVHMYNQSAIPAVYRFLPAVNLISQQMDDIKKYDTIVVLDCGSMQRVGAKATEFRKCRVIINIDHHMTNTQFGDLRLIDANACATAEIVYRLIKKLGVTFDCPIATAIYTGILTDTGSFRFSNTNQQAFTICADMIASGANAYEVAQNVYGHYSLGRIKLLNLALDSLEISANGKLSIMSLTQDMLDMTHTQAEDIDGIINYARRIEDVKVAALIHEVAGNGRERRQYHVSLRSDGDVNVALIAAQFGGGGHASAAGFSVEAALPELKEKIIGLSETTPGLCGMN
jgi:phosphoesterase RecJ-like protein